MEPSQSPWLFLTCPTHNYIHILYSSIVCSRACRTTGLQSILRKEILSTRMFLAQHLGLCWPATACMFCFCSIWHVGQLSAEWANFWYSSGLNSFTELSVNMC